MNEITILQKGVTACIDTLMSFMELFELDIEQLTEVSERLGCKSKVQVPQPKAKFFTYLSKEMERIIESKLDGHKDLSKKYHQQQTTLDAVLFKIKMLDIKDQNLQEQLNDKPTRKDIHEMKEENQQRDINMNIFQSDIQNNMNIFQDNLDRTLADSVKQSELSDQIDSAIQELIMNCQKRYASKEFTLNKLDNLDTQFAFLNEGLLEIKKYSLSNISTLQNTQNTILSDLTATVKQHEYQQFKDSTKEFLKRTEFRKHQMHIGPIMEQIQKCKLNCNLEIKESNMQLDLFAQIIKKTDYELLQKANKMDWEILKKAQLDITNQQTFMEGFIQEAHEKIRQFHQFQQEQAIEIIEQVRTIVNQDIQINLQEQIIKQMAEYSLDDVKQQLDKIYTTLRCKANKNDIVEVFAQKCNKADIAYIEKKVAASNSTCRQLVKQVQEFMELFGEAQDFESFNFKRSHLTKLINDVASLSTVYNKLAPVITDPIRSDFDDPLNSTRRQVKASPKNAFKVFLRPLLSTSFQIPKNNSLNQPSQ